MTCFNHGRFPQMTVDGTHHHQCQPTNCWKCPVCGAVCSSASAAQKHLDNHNGIRAFVCTICQYKGNTLRGLRTHIRMHFNKRMIPDLMVSHNPNEPFSERFVFIMIYYHLTCLSHWASSRI